VPQTLAFTRVTAHGAAPSQWIAVLHGMLGTRANWRTIARRVVTARPAWGAVLFDLRNHGASQGFAGPHTLRAAADDVRVSAEALGVRLDAVVGHSYGGKVALMYAREHDSALHALVTADASPGARPDAHGSEDTVAVLDALEHLPKAYAHREAFVAAFTGRGFSMAMARWLAMNLEPAPGTDGRGEMILRVDTAVLREMLADYLATDLWDVVEDATSSTRMALIVGGRSRVYSEADIARAEAAARGSGGRITVQTLANAGHWVHVDAPEATEAAIVGALTG
jgi:pimeloyl-ACP methyl ester carboxylesterase